MSNFSSLPLFPSAFSIQCKKIKELLNQLTTNKKHYMIYKSIGVLVKVISAHTSLTDALFVKGQGF